MNDLCLRVKQIQLDFSANTLSYASWVLQMHRGSVADLPEAMLYKSLELNPI